MDLRHLQSFITVAEVGGFSKAAARLHISQPALSRQVRDLERELGTRLFDRMGRHVRLTGEGEELQPQARALLADAQAFGERAAALTRGETGILRVGASPQTIESLLASFLRHYRRAHRGVDVRLTQDAAVRLLEKVERGDLHVAVTLPGGGSLRSQLLFPVRVLAVTAASSGFPRRTVALPSLANEPVLLPSRGFAIRQLFDAACQLAHLRPRTVFESDDAHSLIALAAAGHGIAIVGSLARLPRTGVSAAAVRHGESSLGFWAAAVWDPRRFLPPSAASFISQLVAYTRRSYPGDRFHRAPAVLRP
jgi:DNA-binding transcriptional LysR family regulator